MSIAPIHTPLGLPAGPPFRLLFVCLGNICRSPLARAIFEHRVHAGNLAEHYFLDSCGTGGWHEGAAADPRSVLTAHTHGIALTHRARKIRPAEDFARFDLLLAMDRRNERDLIALGADPARVALVRTFDPAATGLHPQHHPEVPDPYYGGQDGFEKIFVMLDAACDGLLVSLERIRVSAE